MSTENRINCMTNHLIVKPKQFTTLSLASREVKSSDCGDNFFSENPDDNLSDLV